MKNLPSWWVNMRRTYFVTYSWTDKTEYLTKESFEEKIAKTFDMGFSKA